MPAGESGKSKGEEVVWRTATTSPRLGGAQVWLLQGDLPPPLGLVSSAACDKAHGASLAEEPCFCLSLVLDA